MVRLRHPQRPCYGLRKSIRSLPMSQGILSSERTPGRLYPTLGVVTPEKTPICIGIPKIRHILFLCDVTDKEDQQFTKLA